MKTTQMHIVNRKSYVCTLPSNVKHKLDNLEAAIDLMYSFCPYNKVPFIIASFMMIMVMVGTVVYRFRHFIKYHWYKLKANIRTLQQMPKYDYDAFVAYSEEDFVWVRHQLLENIEDGKVQMDMDKEFRLCIHHRDWLGGLIADNVVHYQNKSCLTILTLSNKFLKSEWWQFEANMALQLCLDENRNRIIAILLEPLSMRLMTPTVRLILQTVTCFRWSPGNQDKQRVFWARIKATLREGRGEEGEGRGHPLVPAVPNQI
jgi:hypothetical protein